MGCMNKTWKMYGARKMWFFSTSITLLKIFLLSAAFTPNHLNPQRLEWDVSLFPPHKMITFLGLTALNSTGMGDKALNLPHKTFRRKTHQHM